MKKRRIEKYIIIVTFMILTGIVGVSAANTLTSNGVLYSNAVSSVTTVEGALNELYANYNSLLAKGDASASDILSGKKALVKGKEVTGTMTDYGREPAAKRIGVYNNSLYLYVPDVDNGTNGVTSGEETGKITRGIRTPLSNFGTAAAANVLSGQTFTSQNGLKITGTMKNWTGTPQNIDAVRLANGRFEVAVAKGYHDYNWAGNSYEYLTYSQVANTIGLTAAKLAKGQTVLGIAGTYTSDATASASQILSGKTAYVNGSKVTGSMANYANNSIWVNTDNGTFYRNQNHTYSSGATTDKMVLFKSKHSGYFDSNTRFLFGEESGIASVVKAGSKLLGVPGTYTSDATATAGNILSGKTAYVNGSKVTGTMTNQGSYTNRVSLVTGGTTAYIRIPQGAYLTNTSAGYPEITISASDLGITAAKLVKGQTVLGVSGTATSDANATSGNILSGKTAYVNGSKVTGTMTNRGAVSGKITAGGSYTIPAGYHNGSGKVNVTHTLYSWCPNYGNFVNSSSIYTTQTFSVNATSFYVLVRAENGGTVFQYANPSCSNGTVYLLVNNENGILYYVSKAADATFTLVYGINRVYNSTPNATLKVFAFTNN